MSALQTQCPPEEVLHDFGLGKLDAASAETISRHLETCADCQHRVASLSGDSFVGRLRQAGGAARSKKRDGTYVPGESMANSGGNTSWGDVPKSPTRETGPSRTVDGGRKPDGPASPSSVTAPPGLANHPDYELIKELGQGGMGTVYLAKNRMMDRPEVLKVISKSLLDKPGALERFQQEIRSAAKLSHPNIVAAHSVLRPGDLLVFAMEYVGGQDLAEVIKQRGPLPVANAAFYIHQVAQGLQHAFERGMVHRDIKPNNLMLAIEGKKHVVKILDFGLAKATSEKGGETGLTKSGQMLGTPDYVAPEQTLDAHQADIRADIYSLGCTLYFLLSGGPPFQETSLYEILEAHHKREPKPLNLVRPDVPVELAAVVAKMMAKDPTKRYQTPIEVAKALVPFFKPGQSVAPPPADTAHGHVAAASAAPPPATPVPVARPVAVATATPPPAPTAELSDSVRVSTDTRRPVPRRRMDRWRSLPPWQRWGLVVCPAALVIIVGVVLLVQTPHGTVKLDLSDPAANVTVSVDGDQVAVSGLGKPLLFTVGEHDLTVTGDGYETIARKFTIVRGANAPLTVTLVPKPAAAEPKSGDSNGFVSLFNGKDLTGWKPQPDSPTVWRVENGILTGSGEASGYLFTERGNLTNFHLRVEARINDRGDSGVYFRATPGRDMWPKGYEAQINTWDETSDKTGGLYGWGGAGPMVRVADSAARSNEWFTLEIFASDNHIVIMVNGKTTADSIDHARRFPMGHIALEKYRPGTVVEFRKIEITELESVAAARPSVVPADAQEFGGHWYKFYPEELTWKAARNRCQSLGGHLVIIGSLAENAFAASLVEAGAWQDAWIGATDEEEEGRWRDAEGKLLAFTSWSPTGNQPNNKHKEEHYALMSKRAGWRWSDQPNASKEHKPGFVCEWGPDDTQKLGGAVPRDARHAGVGKPATRDEAKRFPCQIEEGVRKDWSIEGDELVERSAGTKTAISFGDSGWSEYDFSVEAKWLNGRSFTVLGFGREGDGSCFYGLGVGGNTGHDTGYHRNGKYFHQGRCQGSLDQGRWYRAEVRVRGKQCECFLDGQRLFAFTSDRICNGALALVTWGTEYRFRNIVVKAPDGTVLLDGLPDVDHARNSSNSTAMSPNTPAINEKSSATQATATWGGWIPLFNGNDLIGWNSQPGEPATWRVENGALLNQAGGRIFSEKTYGDFVLTLEFQVSADTCASIDLLSLPDDTPLWVFLENTRNAMGAITWDGREKGFYVDRLNPPAELRPDGQWNEMTIQLEDSTLKVSLNGRELGTRNVKEHMDRRRPDMPPAQRQLGKIALNKRWGSGSVLLRNLSIKEAGG